MKYLYAFLVIAVFGGLFILIYVLNDKTPKPEGCNDTLSEECKRCNVSICHIKRQAEKKENK